MSAEQAPQRKLKFPVDPKAEPPISHEEALAAPSAICPQHGGLFGQRGEKEGAVYVCLHRSCRMYRRLAKPLWSRHRIRYPARSLA